MTDNVIWGTDFKASKILDGLAEAVALTNGDMTAGAAIWQADAGGKMRRISLDEFYDTAPSEYVAPSDDCA